MTRAPFAPLIGREFDSFLTASVGDDSHGMQLSLLSAFARTDLDPWAEASALARMSREKATARLAAFIADIPNRPDAAIPANTIAADLVALLPTAAPNRPSASSELSGIMASSGYGSSFGLGFSAIALIIVLALIAMAEPKPALQGKPTPAAATDQALPLGSIGQ